MTYDELNAALPPDQVSSEQIEDTMTMLSELGINVIESEEQRGGRAEGEAGEAEGEDRGNLDDDDIGRTDDPVRMYLREMGSVELLSREGEIAIAKRIEAGRDMMIGGICESPLTIDAIVGWRDALNDGKMLLRDIIDLDATFGGGPNAEAAATAVSRGRPRSSRRGSRGGGRGRRVEDEDGEESAMSLSAMEQALKPSVLATFDSVAEMLTRSSPRSRKSGWPRCRGRGNSASSWSGDIRSSPTTWSS